MPTLLQALLVTAAACVSSARAQTNTQINMVAYCAFGTGIDGGGPYTIGDCDIDITNKGQRPKNLGAVSFGGWGGGTDDYGDTDETPVVVTQATTVTTKAAVVVTTTPFGPKDNATTAQPATTTAVAVAKNDVCTICDRPDFCTCDNPSVCWALALLCSCGLKIDART